MNSALLSAGILLITLVLFVWDRVRHDLVAVIALGACMLVGLVRPDQALEGFSDSSVIVIGAVLIIGRAIELTGVAAAATERLARLRMPFPVQLAVLLVAAALLSAFMNNIAALAITMPAVAGICRAARLPPGVGLMPLAFATILGGMTTLIGTPANLILSSVREQELGAAFGFFDMSLVGGAVAAVGLTFLCLVGWRLTPRRKGRGVTVGGRSVFELTPLLINGGSASPQQVRTALRQARAYVLAVVRGHLRRPLNEIDVLKPTDRLVVLSRDDPWDVARKAGCGLEAPESTSPEAVVARVVVGHGSPLIGRTYDTVAAETDGVLRVVAAGPRAARVSVPLGQIDIKAGDQLVLHGPAAALEGYLRYGRLLEVERKAKVVVAKWRALLAVSIYAAAVLTAVVMGVPTAITFAAAAAALAALKFLPSQEVYSSIDWPAIVLIGAMIPVGQSFQSSGAAQIVASQLGLWLTGAPLAVAAACTVTATLLLSIFLNNVATAVIMGPIVIAVARSIGAAPDALLMAVLIGASSDFLTPIGHQNNLLVMGPGGYKFSDYARVGAVLSVMVVATAALAISVLYG